MEFRIHAGSLDTKVGQIPALTHRVGGSKLRRTRCSALQALSGPLDVALKSLPLCLLAAPAHAAAGQTKNGRVLLWQKHRHEPSTRTYREALLEYGSVLTKSFPSAEAGSALPLALGSGVAITALSAALVATDPSAR